MVAGAVEVAAVVVVVVVVGHRHSQKVRLHRLLTNRSTSYFGFTLSQLGHRVYSLERP